MKFWLGVHQTGWLETLTVPLFVSAVRLRKRKKLPRAIGPWALDSGGFSAIITDGCYTTGPTEYAAEVRRWRDEIGGMEWAAIQDWMCEPVMLERTRRTVAEHQQLTVNSWVTLRAVAHDLPWVPILQGWTLADYHRCADLYERHTTTRLAELPLVGIGTMCKRQHSREAAAIIKSLHARGLKNLHGFGFKTAGLTSRKLKVATYLESADSMAWSWIGRAQWKWFRRRLCGTEHAGGCANCPAWAVQWRERLVSRIERVAELGTQTLMW